MEPYCKLAKDPAHPSGPCPNRHCGPDNGGAAPLQGRDTPRGGSCRRLRSSLRMDLRGFLDCRHGFFPAPLEEQQVLRVPGRGRKKSLHRRSGRPDRSPHTDL